MMVQWLLNQHPTALPLLAGLLGLIIGSFLNVLIHRLPRMLESEWQQQCAVYMGTSNHHTSSFHFRYNLLLPKSHCPRCEALIKPWHNLPLLGYLVLRGRCYNCHQPIRPRYFLVELLTGVLFSFLAWHFGWSPLLAGSLLLTSTLLALAFIDADTQLLPDSLTLPLLWLGLLFNQLTGTVALADAVWGAVVGYLSLWLVFHLFKLLTGKDGMGYGDFKLLAALGAWLGWNMLPLVIFLSSITGAVLGVLMILTARLQRGQALPFGPYLAGAGWLAMVWGQDIMYWYFHGM